MGMGMGMGMGMEDGGIDGGVQIANLLRRCRGLTLSVRRILVFDLGNLSLKLGADVKQVGGMVTVPIDVPVVFGM